MVVDVPKWLDEPLPRPPRYLRLHDRPWSAADRERYEAKGLDGVQVACVPTVAPRVTLDFLADLPRLRGVRLWLRTRHEAAVLGLSHLEYLDIDTRARKRLDLTGLPNLKELTVSFRQDIVGLDELAALRVLCLMEWRGDHLGFTREKPELGFVRVDGRKQDLRLDGLRLCPRLRGVMIRNTATASLEPLRGLSDMRSVYITNHPGHRAAEPLDLSVLDGMERLQEVRLVHFGRVRSLAPLRSLPALRIVCVAGEVMDGDLTPLLELPPAVQISGSVEDHPHHSHTAEEIESARGER